MTTYHTHNGSIEVCHADHNVGGEALQCAFRHTNDEGAFFKVTIELPGGAPDLESALYGPLAGDPPVPESAVQYHKRGNREQPSRVLVNFPVRPTRLMTVIGKGRTIYTAYGGPCATREPWDPSLTTPEEKEEAETFWAQHALAWKRPKRG